MAVLDRFHCMTNWALCGSSGTLDVSHCEVATAKTMKGITSSQCSLYAVSKGYITLCTPFNVSVQTTNIAMHPPSKGYPYSHGV